MDRRRFMKLASGLLVAPAVVTAENIMRVKPVVTPEDIPHWYTLYPWQQELIDAYRQQMLGRYTYIHYPRRAGMSLVRQEIAQLEIYNRLTGKEKRREAA